MSLAIFDLDNTLIAGDSDYLWGRFLVEQGVVDRAFYERENQRFYDEYRAGTLDIHEFLRFSLAPLARLPRARLEALRDQFMREEAAQLWLPAARHLVESHRRAGRLPLVITATNRFVTEPIVRGYGIDELLATEPAVEESGEFSGEVAGVPCFQEGKVTRLLAWLEENGRDLEGSWFYSDSHNDLPLLERVSHPVAVDPDPQLEAEARSRGWPVISLRHGETPVELPG